jgi:hypothetical protein
MYYIEVQFQIGSNEVHPVRFIVLIPQAVRSVKNLLYLANIVPPKV